MGTAGHLSWEWESFLGR
jgi:hypothetical protein